MGQRRHRLVTGRRTDRQRARRASSGCKRLRLCTTRRRTVCRSCALMPKDRLWAPWRMQYIEAPKDPTEASGTGCIFCDFPAEHQDEKNLIVHRGERAYVILNGYPYNNGHLMVVPFEHNAKLHNLDAPTRAEVSELTALSLTVLESVYNPGGFNIGIN